MEIVNLKNNTAWRIRATSEEVKALNWKRSVTKDANWTFYTAYIRDDIRVTMYLTEMYEVRKDLSGDSITIPDITVDQITKGRSGHNITRRVAFYCADDERYPFAPFRLPTVKDIFNHVEKVAK